MKRYMLPMIFEILATATASELSFEYAGIDIVHTFRDGTQKRYTVKRHIDPKCRKLPITNELLWTGKYANKSVPQACVSTYVHTTGKLLPIKLHHDILTYGEMETMAFIKAMTSDKSRMLVDARPSEWFDYRTIPGATNIPFVFFTKRDRFKEEFESALKRLGVERDQKGELYFDKAKTLLIFCNGPWCAQSNYLIDALVELGYPEEKIRWYRGGIQTWLQAGMVTTRP